MNLSDRRVVFGVSGGIACYKACTVARRLTEAGAAVDVVMTAAASEFVRPVTFEALTNRPVYHSLWEGGALAHVRLPDGADLTLVAPATANLIARSALGLADDFLTAMLLASNGPVLIAPAMNDRMFKHPATQTNLATLRARGWHVIGPDVGPLAEGPSEKPGRMSEPEAIVAEAARLIVGPGSALRGKRVVVTAGPTREAMDPVRVLSNRSSGRMGFEIATAAYGRGAEVSLITGPTSLLPPFGPKLIGVESTEAMLAAVSDAVADADVVVMAAAPADYRFLNPNDRKRARSDGSVTIELEPTPDILVETTARRKTGAVVVGFALETHDGVERARQKLAEKQLDLVVLNYANEEGAGFEVSTNRVTLVSEDSEIELPLMSKSEVAERILDAAEKLM